jgi:hypothetical protein
MDIFLNEVNIFLTQETEGSAALASSEKEPSEKELSPPRRLANFNHPKKKTRATYNHIAHAIGILAHNCGVMSFQRRQSASGEEYEAKRSGEERIKEQQERTDEVSRQLLEKRKKGEITNEEFAKQYTLMVGKVSFLIPDFGRFFLVFWTRLSIIGFFVHFWFLSGEGRSREN